MNGLLAVYGVLAAILMGCVQGEGAKKAGSAGLDLPVVEPRKYVPEQPKDEPLARKIVAAMNGQGEFPPGIPDYEATLQALGRSVVPLIVDEYASHGCVDGRLTNFILSGLEDPLLVPILVRRSLAELLARKIERVDNDLFDPGEDWLKNKENRRFWNCVNLIRALNRAAVPYLISCLKEGDPRVRRLCIDTLMTLSMHSIDTVGYAQAFEKIRAASKAEPDQMAKGMVDWWEKNRASLNWDEANYRFK